MGEVKEWEPCVELSLAEICNPDAVNLQIKSVAHLSLGPRLICVLFNQTTF